MYGNFLFTSRDSGLGGGRPSEGLVGASVSTLSRRPLTQLSSPHFLVSAPWVGPVPRPPCLPSRLGFSVPQMVCERSDAFASACALARAFPLFTHRAGAARRPEQKTVTVEFFLVGQDNGPVEVSTLQVGVWTFRPCPRAPMSWAARRGVWKAPSPVLGRRDGCCNS